MVIRAVEVNYMQKGSDTLEVSSDCNTPLKLPLISPSLVAIRSETPRMSSRDIWTLTPVQSEALITPLGGAVRSGGAQFGG